MRYYIALVAGIILLMVVWFLVQAIPTTDDEQRFALYAKGGDVEKQECVTGNYDSVLQALEENGFDPKLDNTGLITSIIDYDGSDHAGEGMMFWGYWINRDGQETEFAMLGPAQIKPENKEAYIFEFGDGSATPQIDFSDICK